MNLKSKNLLLAFISMLSFTLFSQIAFPSSHLYFFAPFLILVCYQKSYLSALNYSLLCGIILDMFHSQTHFGLQSLNYIITTAFIYPQKKNFFSDSLMTLPLMTFFFSLVLSSIGMFLLSVFSTQVLFSPLFLITDLMIMPAIDAIFGWIWFIIIPICFSQKLININISRTRS